MPVEQGLPWHPVATGLAGQAIPFVVAASHAHALPSPPFRFPVLVASTALLHPSSLSSMLALVPPGVAPTSCVSVLLLPLSVGAPGCPFCAPTPVPPTCPPVACPVFISSIQILSRSTPPSLPVPPCVHSSVLQGGRAIERPPESTHSPSPDPGSLCISSSPNSSYKLSSGTSPPSTNPHHVNTTQSDGWGSQSFCLCGCHRNTEMRRLRLSLPTTPKPSSVGCLGGCSARRSAGRLGGVFPGPFGGPFRGHLGARSEGPFGGMFRGAVRGLPWFSTKGTRGLGLDWSVAVQYRRYFTPHCGR